MFKPRDPRELVIDLIPRSICSVMVASVIADHHGIFSWGVNHAGFDGFGMHAEKEAIRRSNQKRLRGATIFVAGIRMRTGNPVNAKPCEMCSKLVEKWGLHVIYRNRKGIWIYGQ